MAELKVICDEKALTSNETGICVNISSSENNGLSFNNNKLKANRGEDGNPGSGGTTNRSGNAIIGNSDEPIGKIACGLTVPVKTDVKSGDISGRVNLYGSVIKKLLGRE